MNCRQAQAKFQERLDGRLASAADLEAHLASCAACRRAWQEEQGLWSALGRVPELPPSAGFAERTLRRWRAGDAPARPQGAWWRWAAAVTTVALLAVAGGWVHWSWTVRKAAGLYVSAQTDQLEDFDVIAVLHQLEEDRKL